jgi:hypothetical protein
MADIHETVSSLSALADAIRGVDVDTSGSAISDIREAFAALGDSDRLAGVSGVDDDLNALRSLLDQAADLASGAASRLGEWA